MTVEAALIMPLFIILVLQLLSLMEMLYWDICLEAGLHEVGREMASYSYAADFLHKNYSGQEAESENKEDKEEAEFIVNRVQELLLAEGYAKNRLVEKLGKDNLERSVIDGGASGLNFWRSEINEEGELELILTYRVTPWFDMGKITSKQFVKRCRIHCFLGYKGSQNGGTDGNICYVTKESEVYHIRRNCTHLSLTIRGIDSAQLEGRRNEYGECYNPCEYCMKKKELPEYIYIAEEGRKYHSTLACSGLKRTVYVIQLSQTAGMRRCSRCG